MKVEDPPIIYDSTEEMPEFDSRSIQCYSPVYTEISGLGNPFHNRLKTSFPDFNSPSVFKVQSTPLTTVKTFKWSVEEMALLKPVDIEDCPNQEVVDNSYFITPRRAEASTKFFSGIHSIPSLISPCTSSLPSSRATSNQTLYQDTTPNPYSFSRPPEMLDGHGSPTADTCSVLEEESPQPAALSDNNLIYFPSITPIDRDRSLPPAPVDIPVHSVSTTESVSVGVQTMLTLPLDFDLERVLGRHAYYQGEDMANGSSLRRILFQPSDSSNNQNFSLTSNCVRSPTAQARKHTGRRTSCYRSDPHETPKTSKNVNRSYSKSSLKSRSVKRHPVSSFDVTASTPGSFIMSLMSGRQDCSNLPTPINPVPFLSPIHSRAELDLSQISTESTPPRDSSLCEQDPAPLSPITSSKPSFQQIDASPNPYKATSTPFFQQEPKTPPSRHLPFLSPTLLSGEESPSRDMVTSDYPTQCHDEDVMQEDPAPPTFSEISQIPDKVQVTHSLESDSGIGTSYGEQSSLMQSQSRNRVKPSEHQLSFFCPDKPNNYSFANGNVAKLRGKRGCVKVDSSPLSIVHHALPSSVNESKRYQPDSANPDAFVDSGTSSSSPSRDTESDPCEPLLANPTLVQQQAKHIEAIGKLKNYSKWNTHKKNIESRTSH